MSRGKAPSFTTLSFLCLLRRPEVQGENLFTFEEIFRSRQWLHLQHPSTTLYLNQLNKQSEKVNTANTNKRNKDSNHMTTQSPRSKSKIQTSKILIERLPLSHEGFIGLKETLDKWNKFCHDRENAMNQYIVTDSRTTDQIDEEMRSRIQSRLKKAYKLKKLNKKKAAV